MHAFARKLGIWAVSALSLTAAGAGWAQSVALTGVLGSKALLVIDGGAPKAVASNDSHQGVRVLQVGADSVVVEIKGQR
ncbi:MAG: TIGR02281 family clan AA aspartic protease, partial [Comamonas sp.]